MKSPRFFRWCLGVCALLALTPLMWAASPSLSLVLPRGGQRGTEVEFTLHGDRLKDVEEAMFYLPGVTAKELTPAEDGKSVKLKAVIAPECALGEHYLRLRTRSGLSEVKTFWIGAYPQIAEAEPNNDFAAPQKIALNTTIEGVAENEDVEHFAVELKKGQRLSAEIEGIRLNGDFWDPYVAILDAKRFELAAADDTALLSQDGYTQIIAPEDGTYIVQVRDSSYVGSGGCRYRLHVGTFPRPAVVFPASGKAGTEMEYSLVGDAGGEMKKTVSLPSGAAGPFSVFAEAEGVTAPSANIIMASDLDQALEAEPNDDFAHATAVNREPPLAFNGRIEKPGDVDRFKFLAKKDQKFTFIGHARTVRSPLDIVIEIQNKDGAGLAGNDDAAGFDAKIDFTAPADGEYFLTIYDHLRRGGPDFVYTVHATAVKPGLNLSIPQFARSDFQSRQMMPVPRGNRVAAIVNGNRANFGGDLTFEAVGLPEGVTFVSDVMPQSSGGGYPVVFEAAAEAPIAGTLADLVARPVDPNLQHIRGSFGQKLDLMIRDPNQMVYYSSTINKMAVAVVEEAPFKIDVEEPKVPLVHNGALNLKVVATRQEGFKAPITVRMLYLPPNVGAQPTIQIPEGQNEAFYTLNANGNAETRSWKLAVIGEGDAGQGTVLASSGLIPVTVAAPYLGMKIEMAAIEQGKSGPVLCKLEWTKPFEGKARATLQGLPGKAEAPALEITKDQTEISFPVTTAPDTPAGQHKQLFCYLEIPEAGAVIPHNVGHGGVLRVDTPPPAPAEPVVAEAATPAAPAAPEAPAEKQLSRLEKLRLEARQGLKK